MKRYSIIFIVAGLSALAIYFILSPSSHTKNDKIAHALGLSHLPCQVEIISYEKDDFFEVKLKSKFVFKKFFYQDFLKGRDWVELNTHKVLGREKAFKGYKWRQGSSFSEIYLYVEGDKMRCEMIYVSGGM